MVARLRQIKTQTHAACCVGACFGCADKSSQRRILQNIAQRRIRVSPHKRTSIVHRLLQHRQNTLPVNFPVDAPMCPKHNNAIPRTRVRFIATILNAKVFRPFRVGLIQRHGQQHLNHLLRVAALQPSQRLCPVDLGRSDDLFHEMSPIQREGVETSWRIKHACQRSSHKGFPSLLQCPPIRHHLRANMRTIRPASRVSTKSYCAAVICPALR